MTFSLYFNDKLITYMSFISAGIFLLYIDISKRIEIFKLKFAIYQGNQEEVLKIGILRKIYNHIFLIHGHTMVLIPFIAVSESAAIAGLSFFILVAVKNFLGSLRAQIKLFNKSD